MLRPPSDYVADFEANISVVTLTSKFLEVLAALELDLGASVNMDTIGESFCHQLALALRPNGRQDGHRVNNADEPSPNCHGLTFEFNVNKADQPTRETCVNKEVLG